MPTNENPIHSDAYVEVVLFYKGEKDHTYTRTYAYTHAHIFHSKDKHINSTLKNTSTAMSQWMWCTTVGLAFIRVEIQAAPATKKAAEKAANRVGKASSHAER